MALVLILVAAIGAAGAFFFLKWRSAPSGTGAQVWERQDIDPYYSDDGNLLCGIRLEADRTHAYVGDEDSSVTLTLSVPSYAASGGSVQIVDADDGDEIAAFDMDALEDAGGGWRTANLSYELDTSEDGVTGLRAVAGDYYSPELDFYVTPHITADQIAESAVIGAECNEAMLADHADDTDEERALAAQEWLDADDRVAATSLDEESYTVRFVTTDCVGGAYVASASYAAEVEPGSETTSIGASTSSGFTSDGAVSGMYDRYGDDSIPEGEEGLRIACEESAVASMTDSLSLIPTPEAMAGNTYFQNRYCSDVEYSAEAYADAMGGEHRAETGDSVMRTIVSQDMCNYGFVCLFAHGAYASHGWIEFLMYRSESVHESKDIHVEHRVKGTIEKTIKTEVIERLYLFGLAYKAYVQDPQGKDTFDDFYSEWYTRVDSFSKAGRSKLYITIWFDSVDQFDIMMSSGFIMDRYQDRRFDNTIMYLASCSSLCDRSFNDWLLNHGCSDVFGYKITADTYSNMCLLNQLAKGLSSQSDTHANRLKTFSEVIEDVGRLDARAMVDHAYEVDQKNSLPDQFEYEDNENWKTPWFAEISNLRQYESNQERMKQELEELKKKQPTYKNGQEVKYRDNTLYYVGRDDFLLSGTGDVRGRILYQEVDEKGEPVPDTKPEPVKGARVTVRRLLNRSFSSRKGRMVKVKNDGTFSLSDWPMGHLVLTVEVGGKESDPYQLYLADDEWDGGDIYLTLHRPVLYIHVKDSEGNIVNDAKVTLKGDDGSLYNAKVKSRSSGKSFMARVDAQHYTVNVVPNDTHLSEATVEIDVPDSEPWVHDVTIVLDEIEETCDISGIVCDAKTKGRLQDAEVSWSGPSGEGVALTDPDGNYEIERIKAGEYTLTFGKAGYESQTKTVKAKVDTAMPTIYLEPKLEEAAYSACIDDYGGATYMIEPVASGLQLLPTPCARYDYICNFAFYNDKIYYCCKEAGTAQYHMALYEANLDGSDARELYAPTEPMPMSGRFAIRDGVLYFQSNLSGPSTGAATTALPVIAIELDTGTRNEASSVPEDVSEFLDSNCILYGEEKIHPGEGINTFNTDTISVTHADGSTEAFVVIDGASLKLEAVVPIAGENDAYVYYSASEDGYRTYKLFRRRLSGGERETLGSRPAAGGGGYFAW